MKNALFILALAVVMACAADSSDMRSAAKSLDFSGYTSFEFGQIVKGVNRNGQFERKWLEGFNFGLSLEAGVGERLRVFAAGECQTSFSYIVNLTNIDSYRETQFARYSIKPIRAGGVYRLLGSSEAPALQMGIGYYPFKYNPQVRNLGEFLFRSGTYPSYLLNEFDAPYARLLGLRLNSMLMPFSWLNAGQDLMLTSEVDRFPQKDFSLSYVAALNIARFFELGGGMCFSGLIPVDESVTAPNASGQNILPDSSGNYTFAGTKVMARATIDPKRFIRLPVFGKEDLKIYGEIAFLGLKNYPVYYKALHDRMPMLAGFNFPGFKILDVIALEAEIWNNAYPNSYETVFKSAIPRPYTDEYSANYAHINWKWSIYAAKEITKGFTLIAQVARDHLQPPTHSLVLQDRTDVLQTSEHSWWVVKTKFAF